MACLVGSAFGGIFGQLFMGYAYRYAGASILSIFWNLETVI